jgi:phosphate transport system permease protein
MHRATTLPPPAEALAGTHPLRARRGHAWGEEGIRRALALAALLSVGITTAIVVVLCGESARFFSHVSWREFLIGTRWAPLFEPPRFGVLPLVVGTLHVVVGSCLLAVPVGVGTALWLSEYATERGRACVKPVLEVLAGIPSVVYGYFAVTAITPVLKRVFTGTEPFNSASASIVVAVMILPLVASLCDDALRAVPRSLREGAYAVGATRREVCLQILLPAALSGVTAAVVLAISRAIGETMAVSLAAGNLAQLSLNPLRSIQTMTGFIVQVSQGDTPAGTVEYQTIFAVGLLLFAMTLTMNLVADAVFRRFREVYE